MTRPFMLGDVRVEPASNEILLGGARKRIRRKLMDALVYLSAQGGRVVERNELLEHVWRERPASDESLTQLMSELRRTLGANGGGEPMLHTISGKGYRLSATIGAVAKPLDLDSSLATGNDHALRASDRRWGFALLLGVFIAAQALALLLGGGGHHP